MRDYKPNPQIIKRAARIWGELLTNPKYDNGDNTFRGAVSATMAAMCPNNSTPPRIKKFEEELERILSTPNPESNVHCNYLGVDYGPDKQLAEAADLAGLKMQFPWKTRMFIWNDYVSIAAGYGAPDVYHYPLKNDRWLITTLRGNDITKIIKLVEDGVLDVHLTLAQPKT